MENIHPVNLSKSGPPETILSAEDPVASAALERALEEQIDRRRDAVAEVVADWPQNLDAWACLGEVGRDRVESYAAYRVGYHLSLIHI